MYKLIIAGEHFLASLTGRSMRPLRAIHILVFLVLSNKRRRTASEAILIFY